MKTLLKFQITAFTLLFLSLSMVAVNTFGATGLKKDQKSGDPTFVTFKGKVIDAVTDAPIIFAAITVENTNIATVTNSEGDFQIKIPKESLTSSIKISILGYENIQKSISELNEEKNNIIRMKMVSVPLTEISVFPNNPRLLLDKVMQNRLDNYQKTPMLMTAFYRETIKKRRNYVGLAEAVVEVYKQPYQSPKNDAVKLYKGRRSTNVEKMDTLLFKLQGGPYSTLMLDIMKDPYLILDDATRDNYDYSYVNITRVDGKLSYVIEFKQRAGISTPLFYGKFYIDIDNFAISSAFFSLNTENRSEASAMFIKRKPLGVNVYPISANYMVNYTEKDGKWHYSYSRGEVEFKVKWNKKLLNTTFTTMVEMAITDWKFADEITFKPADKMKTNIILDEEVSDFSDDDFWGEYNTIEPEKSIENAIKKIGKTLKP